MDVHLTPEQQARLDRMAQAQGCDAQALVQEALDRFLSYDQWISDEIDRGLEGADRGELLEHADVRRMIELRYPA